MADQLFDEWPERYEEWFRTPIGRLVRQVEGELVREFLRPLQGETILDAGCGTGIFTTDFLDAGTRVVGLDISRPMLHRAQQKTVGMPFEVVEADMIHLPFADITFDKAVSITALEFVADAGAAVRELFRVTRPGGVIVAATLNSLSPWAARRSVKTTQGQRHVLEKAYYRSGRDLLDLMPIPGISKSAVHFQKDDDVDIARKIEKRGKAEDLLSGAFVAVRWEKPD
jgi:ubiquinone/menaquinone biosynthesis C-methylase UbiE